MTDFYTVNADIYAAVNLPALSGQLAGLRSVADNRFAGPVLDVGAGVGATLNALASLTDHALYAIEPSAHMRVGLMTTVVNSESLRERVTVLGGTLDDTSAHLPDRLGGIVALNALGHFEPSELDRFWDFARQRLQPGGRLIVGLQPPFEPVEIPWTDFGQSQVGDLTYRTSGTASISSDDGMARWTMRWTIHDATGAELERRATSTQWAVIGPDHVAESAKAVGLEPSSYDLDANLYSFQQVS